MIFKLSNINALLFSIIFILIIIDATIVEKFFSASNTLIFLILLLLPLINLKKIRFDFYSLVLIIPIILFCLLSVLFSKDLHLGGYNSALIVLIQLLYFSMHGFVFNTKIMNVMLMSFCLFVGLTSFYVWSNQSLVIFGAYPNSGIFINPNSLGEFVLFTLIYITLFIQKASNKTLLALIFLPLLLLSASRGSLFALLLFALFYMLHTTKTLDSILLKYLLMSLILCVVGFAIHFFLYDEVQLLFNKIQTLKTTGRTEIWISVMEKIFMDLKIFTVGTGPSTTLIDGKSAHNSYLNESANMGVFFVFFYVLLLIYKYVSHSFQKNIYFISVFFPILFLGFFESILFVNNILWSLLIFFNIYDLKKQKRYVMDNSYNKSFE